MKKALVTAGASPLGSAVAKKLNDAGYELTLHYHQTKPVFGTNFIKGNLVDADEMKRVAEEAVKLGLFDVVVNNAGIFPDEDLDNINFWEEMFRINTIFPSLLMSKGEKLVKQGGCFVNISTAIAHPRFGDTEALIYSASKAALNSLTRTFAKKLAPSIRVNALAPGYVDSRWTAAHTEVYRTRLAKEQLVEKLITKDQVASAVLELVRNEGINGEIIYFYCSFSLWGWLL